jgi:hypothetical protein
MAKPLFIEAIFKGQKLKTGLKQSESDLRDFAASAKRILAGVGIALGTKELLGFIGHTARLGAEARNIEMAFRGVAGGAKEAANLLNEMRRATLGAVSDLNLMKNASRAVFFGVPIERMPDLLRAARTAAIATGQDMGFMLDSLVLGLGRMSPMIIDNLALSIRLTEAFDRYAAQLGKTADQLTLTERKQALLEEVMRASAQQAKALGGIIEQTDLERLTSLSVAWENLKVAIGELTSMPLAQLATDMSLLVKSFEPSDVASFRIELEKLAPTLGEIGGILVGTRIGMLFGPTGGLFGGTAGGVGGWLIGRNVSKRIREMRRQLAWSYYRQERSPSGLAVLAEATIASATRPGGPGGFNLLGAARREAELFGAIYRQRALQAPIRFAPAMRQEWLGAAVPEIPDLGAQRDLDQMRQYLTEGRQVWEDFWRQGIYATMKDGVEGLARYLNDVFDNILANLMAKAIQRAMEKAFSEQALNQILSWVGLN